MIPPPGSPGGQGGGLLWERAEGWGVGLSVERGVCLGEGHRGAGDPDGR